MAEITFGEAYGEAGRRAMRPSVLHLAGGVVSLALIVGIGVWGGKIIMRDVSGIPVVQAMGEGPMRIAPENPGGDVATHAGLTVNAIAAEGEAAAPEDRLVLAPQALDVTGEDLEVSPMAETGEVPAQDIETVGTAAARSGELGAPMTADEVLALADQIVAEAQTRNGATPLVPPATVAETTAETTVEAGTALAPIAQQSEDVAADPVVAETDATEEAIQQTADDPVAAALAEALGGTEIDVIPASVPGVARSIRPWARPGTAQVTQASVRTAPSIPVSGDLPVGTKLVQLGAYDSADLARTDWARISGRFADYMSGKDPVIQQATSGGREFYRLRAQGFADLSDARRFCAVLMAENAACIPVVVR